MKMNFENVFRFNLIRYQSLTSYFQSAKKYAALTRAQGVSTCFTTYACTHFLSVLPNKKWSDHYG